MKRRLPRWCKEVKKSLIDRDMTATSLAAEIGVSRPYVTQAINGRYLPELGAKITTALEICVPYPSEMEFYREMVTDK